MNGWSEVAHQDPWGPSHDKSGWKPSENTGWGGTPTQETAWATWGRSDSNNAGGGTWGNDTSPGPWGTQTAESGWENNDAPATGWGNGNGNQTWSEEEEEEEEEEEDDGDSGWGEGNPHWTSTIPDGGEFRSHWTKWGRTEGGPPLPIPPSAVKRSHWVPQPSTKPQSAQKHPYKDHAESLNRLLSSSTRQPTPSHKSRPTSIRSQPKPHAYMSPRTQWPGTRAAPSSTSSDGLSYADDEPALPVQHHRLPPREDYFTPKSAYTPISPSRTLVTAMGLPSPTHFASPNGKDPQTHHFVSSDGVAFEKAHKALYSRTRRTQDRLHWAYNPDNDDRVKSALWWIHMMSEGVGDLGVRSCGPLRLCTMLIFSQFRKFLETNNRGALFVNADYTPPQSPHEPAFDWVTIDELKDTLDKILQESVALYDPAKQVIVFIFLLSKSGNSMAIWRRKIPVPEVLQTTYKDAIAQVKAGLQENYPVYVEESVIDSFLCLHCCSCSFPRLPQRALPEEPPRDTGPRPRRVLSKRSKRVGTVATTPITPTTEIPPPVVPKKKWWKPWSSKSKSKAAKNDFMVPSM